MYELNIHKSAQKAFQKAPRKIKKKVLVCLSHFTEKGLSDLPFAVKPLKGSYKKHKYFKVKLDYDYRIIFRVDKKAFYIRTAGTHNDLGTA